VKHIEQKNDDYRHSDKHPCVSRRGKCCYSISKSGSSSISYSKPLWMKVISKLPTPCIPDFLMKRVPSLMGLVVYGFLPSFIMLGYVFLIAWIALSCGLWTYVLVPLSILPLFLVYLKLQIVAFENLVDSWTRTFTWKPMDQNLKDYLDLLKKQKH